MEGGGGRRLGRLHALATGLYLELSISKQLLLALLLDLSCIVLHPLHTGQKRQSLQTHGAGTTMCIVQYNGENE